MNILKYKYKAHKLVNTFFYLIIFIIGFLIGLGVKKISFNDILSKVLMIDNVEAYTITTIDEQEINEEFIYNAFSTNFSNFNLDDFPYISCEYQPNSTYFLSCRAMSTEYLSLLYNYKSYSSNYQIGKYSGSGSFLTFSYSKSGTFNNIQSIVSTDSSTYVFTLINNTSGSAKTYTNFDINLISGVPNTHNDKVKKLDFSDYGVNLEFNENLFKDNPDFKEVCIDKGKKYAVTSTNIDPVSNTLFVSDFMWFPGKTTGVKYSEYDSLNDDNILIFNDDISTENYYFKDLDSINSIYNDEITSNYFNHAGYTDKYSYYGYTAYKFIHSYYVDENNKNQNMFTIFDFSNINFSPFGSAGGSSSSFGDTPLTYCFYIKNEFNVTELKNDEWNDYTGVVPTPGGDLDVNTSYNKNHSNTNSSLSQPLIFLNSMKDTINFINSLIYEFYMSLPVLLRTFIITLFIILIIMLIMRIGGY